MMKISQHFLLYFDYKLEKQSSPTNVQDAFINRARQQSSIFEQLQNMKHVQQVALKSTVS